MSTPHEKGPHREFRDTKTTAAPRQRTFVLMYPFLNSPIIQGAYDRYLVCALLTPALHAQPQDPPLAFCKGSAYALGCPLWGVWPTQGMLPGGHLFSKTVLA